VIIVKPTYIYNETDEYYLNIFTIGINDSTELIFISMYEHDNVSDSYEGMTMMIVNKTDPELLAGYLYLNETSCLNEYLNLTYSNGNFSINGDESDSGMDSIHFDTLRFGCNISDSESEYNWTDGFESNENYLIYLEISEDVIDILLNDGQSVLDNLVSAISHYGTYVVWVALFGLLIYIVYAMPKKSKY
jgi:hypothetical protein